MTPFELSRLVRWMDLFQPGPDRADSVIDSLGFRGKRTVNSVPASSDERTSIVPPCALTMRSAM